MRNEVILKSNPWKAFKVPPLVSLDSRHWNMAALSSGGEKQHTHLQREEDVKVSFNCFWLFLPRYFSKILLYFYINTWTSSLLSLFPVYFSFFCLIPSFIRKMWYFKKTDICPHEGMFYALKEWKCVVSLCFCSFLQYSCPVGLSKISDLFFIKLLLSVLYT